MRGCRMQGRSRSAPSPGSAGERGRVRPRRTGPGIVSSRSRSAGEWLCTLSGTDRPPTRTSLLGFMAGDIRSLRPENHAENGEGRAIAHDGGHRRARKDVLRAGRGAQGGGRAGDAEAARGAGACGTLLDWGAREGRGCARRGNHPTPRARSASEGLRCRAEHRPLRTVVGGTPRRRHQPYATALRNAYSDANESHLLFSSSKFRYLATSLL